jgi:hypothetical protein
VIRYIENQQEYHGRKSFREECVELLKRFNMTHDQRYIFQPVGSRLDAAPTELIADFRPVTIKISLLRSLPGPYKCPNSWLRGTRRKKTALRGWPLYKPLSKVLRFEIGKRSKCL